MTITSASHSYRVSHLQKMLQRQNMPPASMMILLATFAARAMEFSFLRAIISYATNSVTPPASLIFLSASLLKNLALTTIGISGIRPLPSTFE